MPSIRSTSRVGASPPSSSPPTPNRISSRSSSDCCPSKPRSLERPSAGLGAAGDPDAVALGERPAAQALHPHAQGHHPARLDAARRPHPAQERDPLAASQLDLRVDARRVRRTAPVGLDQREGGRRVHPGGEADRVAGRAEERVHDRRRQVAVAEPGRAVGALGERDPQAHLAGQPAGCAAHGAARGLGDRQRGDGVERREPGRVVDVGLVGDRRQELLGDARVVIDADRAHRGRARQRADRADDRGERVVRHGADVVAGGGVLVRPARDRGIRLADDPVDVGVLEEQVARAGALERVAERPHAGAVGVGDRADRPQPQVAARVADGDGRAGAQRLHREGPRAVRQGRR